MSIGRECSKRPLSLRVTMTWKINGDWRQFPLRGMYLSVGSCMSCPCLGFWLRVCCGR